MSRRIFCIMAHDPLQLLNADLRSVEMDCSGGAQTYEEFHRRELAEIAERGPGVVSSHRGPCDVLDGQGIPY